MKKIKLVYLGVLLCASPPLLAKVAMQDVLNDQKYYSQQLQGIAVPDSVRINDWKRNGKVPNVESTNKWTPLFRGCSNNFTLRNGVSHYQEVLVTGVGSLDAQTGSIIIPVNGRPTGKYVIPFDSDGRTNDYIYFIFASDHSVKVVAQKYGKCITGLYVR